MLNIKNYSDRAELYIYGDIITDTEASWLKKDEDGTLGYQYPTKIKEQLDSLKGLPIDVHLASDGGDVAAGIAIYNLLANHDATVTVYIDSWAASIASLIALAGQKLIMYENTFLMIHNPRAGAFGEADYLRSVADWLIKLKNMLAETYAKESGKDILEVQRLMDAETWFTAQEASEFFPKVELTEATNIEAVASLKSKYKAYNESEETANKVEPLSNKVEPLSNEAEPEANKVEPLSDKVEPLSDKKEAVANKEESVSNKEATANEEESTQSETATNEADKSYIINILREAYSR